MLGDPGSAGSACPKEISHLAPVGINSGICWPCRAAGGAGLCLGGVQEEQSENTT